MIELPNEPLPFNITEHPLYEPNLILVIRKMECEIRENNSKYIREKCFCWAERTEDETRFNFIKVFYEYNGPTLKLADFLLYESRIRESCNLIFQHIFCGRDFYFRAAPDPLTRKNFMKPFYKMLVRIVLKRPPIQVHNAFDFFELRIVRRPGQENRYIWYRITNSPYGNHLA